VMEQEQQFLNALQTVATARFEGDRLELRTAADALAATLSRASAE
jgi:heat shock protein HslJ